MRFSAFTPTLAKRWWIAGVTTAIIFLPTLVKLSLQPKTREAQATFIMKPHNPFIVNGTFVRFLDPLRRRNEINSAYVWIAGRQNKSNRSALKKPTLPES